MSILSSSGTSTTADEAYAALRQMVLRGELGPGQRVSQRRLARQLGCSTVPVLEAMRRLESDGLLIKEPRHMARVRELSAAELEGLYLVREGLEAVAARLAAQRIEPDQLQALRGLSERFDAALAAGDWQATGQADVELHRRIAQAARCPLLAEELDRLLLIERTAGQLGAADPAAVSPYTSHRALLQALEDRDADAAEYFMKKHIQAGYRDVLRRVEGGGD